MMVSLIFKSRKAQSETWFNMIFVVSDDSWLSIRPEDLESLLEAKFQSGGLNPDDIPTKLKEFMKQISDFSGVESGYAKNNNYN